MMENFQHIYNKIERLDKRLDHIDTNLAVYNNLLDIHIKRTDQNEKMIQLTERKQEQAIQELKLEVQKFRTGVQLLHWAIGVSIAVAGIVLGVIRLFG